MSPDRDKLRSLPSVERVVQLLGPRAPHRSMVRAARRAIDKTRGLILDGNDVDENTIVAQAGELLSLSERARLHPVINATGVLIHTNLGRVPLSDDQLDAVAAVASNFSNLEYDIERGRRGDRYENAAEILCEVTGAEAALVVNNNAAAVLVSLAALSAGRDVVISRGELIEIGGEFRIPDVMNASGARLVEVGTTNRTHLADYQKAVSSDTGAVLKVHPSNYRVVGFTATVSSRELATLAHGHGLPLIHDLGSGLLATDEQEAWLSGEVPVQVALADGADLVTFSGDKLLGGPQAGIIVGRRELVDRIKRHPLMRAIRVDKMTLAALESTMASYLTDTYRKLPFWTMALASSEDLATRAEALRRSLADLFERGAKVEAIASDAVTGGGSLPGQRLSSWALSIQAPDLAVSDLDRRLRHGSPPIVARISDDRLVLDLRSIDPRDDDLVADRIRRAITS
ncbi:MAG: L-seryl-tRNA(Sec) selenium transferase [Actinobacteria bacterium]|nr:L-seryl-tRNA(Sec) selenium transferase [Actinomycetota bacterium]